MIKLCLSNELCSFTASRASTESSVTAKQGLVPAQAVEVFRLHQHTTASFSTLWHVSEHSEHSLVGNTPSALLFVFMTLCEIRS